MRYLKGRRLLLLLLICFAGSQLRAQTPDLTATPNEGCAPNAKIIFAVSPAILIGDPGSIEWDFGDGTPSVTVVKKDGSISRRMTHTYQNAGTYKVTVYKEKDFFALLSVVINPAPEVDFSADIRNSCQNPVTITFTDDATVPGRREWVFGDEGLKAYNATENTIKHTYTNYGDHASWGVMLRFTDEKGCASAIVRKDNFIQNDVPPTTVGPASTVEVCLGSAATVTGKLTRIDPRHPLKYFSWDFGDGHTLPDPGTLKDGTVETNPSHTYDRPGKYTALLTVVTETGCRSTNPNPVQVLVKEKPSATITLPDFDCNSMGIGFEAQDNPGTVADAWEWDFGDGAGLTDSVNTAYHAFSSAGKKLVTLYAYSKTCKSDPIRKIIQVKGPTAGFDLQPPACNHEQVFGFTDHSVGADVLRWDFGDPATGDGNFSTGATPAHTYTQSGEYTVELQVKSNINGCRDTLRQKIFAVTRPPALEIPAYTICKDAPVKIQAAGAPYFTGYAWNFGDNTTAAGREPGVTKTYDQKGSYTVSVTVQDTNGCSYIVKDPQPIRVYTPVANFQLPATICFNEPVVFTDKSVAYPPFALEKWAWNFGDGEQHAEQQVTKTFTVSGTHTASLHVTDQNGCAADTTLSFVVHPPPVLMVGTDSASVCAGQAVRLTALSDARVTWWPDYHLDCADCESAAVSPPLDTLYRVKAVSPYGCSAEDSVHVTVYKDFRLKVNPAVKTICGGDSVELQAGGAFRYKWDPGLSSCDTCNSIRVQPGQTTTYYVNGYDEHQCFIHRDSARVTVHPGPEVDLGINRTVVVGTPILLDATVSDRIVQWKWEPADYLSCDNCPNPLATPEIPITYRVTVTDKLGCKNSDSIHIRVACSQGQIFIPNTFTPNGDGMNDRFYPHGKGVKQVRYFHVYNRWGQLVFSRENFQLNDLSAGWDGTSKGRPLPAGVYVYISQMVCVDGIPFPVRGNVTLLR